MDVSSTFKIFLGKLAVKNQENISTKYKTITKLLNKKYWEHDSDTRNSLQVGSYGRGTAINGISDLDMVFELPESVFKRFDNYEGNGQSALLQEVRDALRKTYPNSSIKGDGQVVVIAFKNYVVEILPSFLQSDNTYKYPDSNNGGSWKITKPRQERDAINALNNESGGNLKKLCKMTRAWKNHHGVAMGGLLIDTLCYNFLHKHPEYTSVGLDTYHFMIRDFFAYLSNEDKNKKYWLAPGSNQKVFSKGNFVTKAKRAHQKCLKAIENIDQANVYSRWKGIFGRLFPSATDMGEKSIEEQTYAFRDTEEYICDQFPVDIRYDLIIECEVKQNGFQTRLLRQLRHLGLPLLLNKTLDFYVVKTDVPQPYTIKWKVRNVGAEAMKRDQIRGQIWNDTGKSRRRESSTFQGGHFVECYVIKDGVCVARDRIDVSIENKVEELERV